MRICTFALLFVCAGLALAQTPAITDGGVLNGASFAKGQAVTAGSLVSIFGTNLASKVAQADTIPLSNTLGGVTVLFINGTTAKNAPMLFVQPDNATTNVTSQLNVQIPWDLIPAGASATVKVIVTNNGPNSNTETFAIAPFSPGVFASNGLAIAVNSDGTLAWAVGAVHGLTTPPAKVGCKSG